MNRIQSLTGATLIDHTVDTTAGILAGFLVRKHERDLGHVWTQGGLWHWRSASGRQFGERQKKHAAVQALLDAFAVHQQAQRALPIIDVTTAAPVASKASPKSPRARRNNNDDDYGPVVFDSTPIVWATESATAANIRERLVNGFKKQGAQ